MSVTKYDSPVRWWFTRYGSLEITPVEVYSVTATRIEIYDTVLRRRTRAVKTSNYRQYHQSWSAAYLYLRDRVKAERDEAQARITKCDELDRKLDAMAIAPPPNQ